MNPQHTSHRQKRSSKGNALDRQEMEAIISNRLHEIFWGGLGNCRRQRNQASQQTDGKAKPADASEQNK